MLLTIKQLLYSNRTPTNSMYYLILLGLCFESCSLLIKCFKTKGICDNLSRSKSGILSVSDCW